MGISEVSAKQRDSRARADSAGEAERSRPAQPALCTEADVRLSELYERHFARLVLIAQRALPSEERANAEDLVQTVFEEAARASRQGADHLPAEGWLKTRLRSRIIDRHRQRYRDQRRGEALAAEYRARLGQTASDHAGEEDAVNLVYAEELLRTIPDPVDRAALALKLRDFSERDIARMLNLSYETREVRDRMARVRVRVRAWQTSVEGEGTSSPAHF